MFTLYNVIHKGGVCFVSFLPKDRDTTYMTGGCIRDIKINLNLNWLINSHYSYIIPTRVAPFQIFIEIRILELQFSCITVYQTFATQALFSAVGSVWTSINGSLFGGFTNRRLSFFIIKIQLNVLYSFNHNRSTLHDRLLHTYHLFLSPHVRLSRILQDYGSFYTTYG